MKKKSVLLMAFVSIALFAMAQDWECQDCPKRSLARFDLDVQVTLADWQQMGFPASEYGNLYHVAAGAFEALYNDDPSEECLSFYEGALDVQLTGGVDTTSIGVGGQYASLPPAGGDISSNYLLTGSVTHSGGKKVTVELVVQASATGEIVAQSGHAYDPGISGFQNGRMAAQQLMPLMGKIREFEKSKRDSDPEVVVEFGDSHAGEAKIEPEKEKLKGKESMKVKFRVLDCDDVPVKNMKLEISCTGGTTDPSSVTTDGSGEATVTYTAPCEPGTYAMRLKFYYRRPFEEAGLAEQWKAYYEKEETVQVEPGNKFRMNYGHTSKMEYGGQFLLNSNGVGVIACTVNEEAEPPAVKGTGMVEATWTGNADQCIFNGKSNFSVNYEGRIVSGEDGLQYLELWKTDESDMGGKFTISCAGVVQEIPGSFPIPAEEEDRVLRFELKEGATNAFDVPGTDTHYEYTLDMGCN